MGKCSFQHNWLLKTDSKGYKISSWAKRKDDDHLWCSICETPVNINKGFQAVSQHYDGKKHKNNALIKMEPHQLHLTGLPAPASPDIVSTSTSVPVKQISLCTADTSTKAELIWAMKCVSSNYSAKSCDGVADVFKCMFSDERVSDFSLGSTKFSYLVTEALGPHFKVKMLEDAYKSYYSVQYDETTNNEGLKELQISLKYWSHDQNQIKTSHLKSIFMGSAKAHELSPFILKTLDEAALSLNKLIMIGSDGPRVNGKVFRIINEEIKCFPDRTRGLLQIGTCNLHIVNNAFLKGLEAFGSDVIDLVIGVYYYFKGRPLRNEEFMHVQEKKQLPKHKFIKHCSTRWLTLEAAVERLLEQWPAIRHYFLEFIPSKKDQRNLNNLSFKTIINLLRSKNMKAQLVFVLSSAQVFIKFKTIFQKEEPLIHILYEEIENLIISVARRVCKKESVIAASQSENFADLFLEKNLLLSNDVVCGAPVLEEIKKLSENNQKEFINDVRKHFVEMGRYLVENTVSVDSSNKLKLFCSLQPKEILKEESVSNIIKLAKYLPGSINLNILMDEWHLLQSENFDSNSSLRIDHFWRQIFGIKNALGQVKYPIIQDVVKMCLAVSHGSADVERGFSLSKRLISEDKTKMSEKTLNAKLHIIDALKHYDFKVNLVPITKDLLSLARSAGQKYKQYLEEERKKKEELLRKEEEKKKNAEEEINKRKEIEKNMKNIDQLEKSLQLARKEESEKEKLCDKLLEEGNKRLIAGIKNQDFIEIQLAQAMIESARMKKTEENEIRAKTLCIEKKLQKRKSSLITNFFEKKSKTE